jgi:hypothetical protein
MWDLSNLCRTYLGFSFFILIKIFIAGHSCNVKMIVHMLNQDHLHSPSTTSTRSTFDADPIFIKHKISEWFIFNTHAWLKNYGWHKSEKPHFNFLPTNSKKEKKYMLDGCTITIHIALPKWLPFWPFYYPISISHFSIVPSLCNIKIYFLYPIKLINQTLWIFINKWIILFCYKKSTLITCLLYWLFFIIEKT